MNIYILVHMLNSIIIHINALSFKNRDRDTKTILALENLPVLNK